MSPRYYWNTASVCAVAVRLIGGLQTWRDHGRSVTGALLVEVLAWAAALGWSVSRAAQWMSGVSDESVRQALHANLPSLETLREEVGDAWRKSLPRRLRRKSVTIAIDYHKRPYYGDAAATPGVRGGKELASTHWFWTYASAAILTRGERFTVALEPVFHHESMEVVLERLWQQMAKIPLKIQRLLLDREFCAADAILWLQRKHVPFILPLIRRGQFGRTRRHDQGNARFFRRGSAGIFTYEWQPRSSSRTRERICVRVACVPRGRRRPLVYLVSQPNWSLRWIQKIYETRFGIESTFRQLGQALAQTTTRDPCWRLLLVAIALLLRNVWVLCQQLAWQPGSITFTGILQWLAQSIVTQGLQPQDGFYAKQPTETSIAALL
jgi:Transposase DDE domain